MIAPGTRLGPYVISAPIGAGGMGEVYNATDARLDRTVAVKVLPEHVASTPDLKQRFEREAKTLAALSHPHICPVFDVGSENGVDFLVMEYLVGETLEQRLKKGALPLDQALRIGIQIADALAAAHRAGIVHRDLKPGNVMLTKSGAKLLDFGLAKTGAPAVAGSLSMLPTTPPNLTAQGTILGTFQYMAPEQLEGQEADARTDIFAFGAVLYEMVTGKKAFEGKSQASLIAAILEREPPRMSSLQPQTPSALEHIVCTCLAKNVEARFHAAHDVLVDLRWIAEIGFDVRGPALGNVQLRKSFRLGLGLGASVIALALAGLTMWWRVSPRVASPVLVSRSTIVLPLEAGFFPAGRFTGANIAISPDGTRVVYAGGTGNRSQLYLRSLDQLDVTAIAGTGDAQSPFFSPDGQWVAFFAEGKLKKVPIGGGAPVVLCDAPFGFGGTWGEDGTIVFAGELLGGLSRVSADGGMPQAFTTLAKGEGSHRWPAMLPGGRDVLFAIEASFSWNDARIALQSLDATTEHRVLLDGGTFPKYTAPGYLVFARAGSLLAARFDAARRTTTGPPQAVLQGVAMTTLGGNAHYALSENGTLVYFPGGEEDVRRSLVWVDRTGNAEPLPVAARGFETPRLSPDGQRVVVTIREGDSDVWVLELGRGTLTRITYEAGEDHSAIWTPDGKRITYSSTRASQSHVLLKNADGSGDAEKLFAADEHQHLGGWTPDGRTLLTDGSTTSGTGSDLYAASVDEKGPPRVFVRTPFVEQNAQLSPDGRWVAYRSDESGRPEVYVQAFPGPGGRWQISTDGGTEPVWARNGRDLFYRNGDAMMTVAVDVGGTFRAGQPRVLFKGNYVRLVWLDANFDVSPDGQRLLMVRDSEAGRPPNQLNVIQGWVEELTQLVPSN